MRSITRRQVLLATAVAVRGMPIVFAQEPVREDYRDYFSGEIPDLELLGTKPALREEVRIADGILERTPTSLSPLDVFLDLEAVKQVNADREAYNGGWRERWNPLIVRFFERTKTKPSGDTTPWCAASLNWALARSGWLTTNSASSGSFRDSPGVTEKPQKGDIVVFSRTNAAEANAGRGHVGIFLEWSSGEILVLGGNQKNNFGHHSVCRKHLSIKGKSLLLHSVHAAEAFRK